MFSHLKKQPLVGLALAVAAGIVLATAVLSLFGAAYLWYLHLDVDTRFMLADVAFLLGTMFFVRYFIRKNGWRWFWKIDLVLSTVCMFLACVVVRVGLVNYRVATLSFAWWVIAIAAVLVRHWLWPLQTKSL